MKKLFSRRHYPATLPPSGLPGLDPSWSRFVPILDSDGREQTFHVLDSWAGRDPSSAVGTLLCVHGNPTWSYLWRRLIAEAPPGWRVIAPDHLGMGFSERPASPRTLAQRVEDLNRLTEALELTGPVVTVAHDWGGIISLGWAREHRDQLAGVVLTNTAVHQPSTSKGPVLIRLAHVPWINAVACSLTPLFVRTTTGLTRPLPPRAVRNAYSRPYGSVRRRQAVSDFVADIPFAAAHPSRPALDVIANDIRSLGVPALLLWGPRDPVFGEEHLRDLRNRLPQAELHRFEKASHLLPEDAPSYPAVIADWLRDGDRDPLLPNNSGRPGILTELQARSGDNSVAVLEMNGGTISWSELSAQVSAIAAGLAIAGVKPGHRVALLVPPSIALTVALYAVWRAGAVIVVADKGLGLRGMGRALRSAQLDHVIADTAGLLAAGPMRLPGSRIAVSGASTFAKRVAGVEFDFDQLASVGAGQPVAPDAAENDEAAVLFTSGATGPAKGVRYRHRQVRAQLALIRQTYHLTADDRLVAAFAPFALYGPALGVPSVVPSTDVTKPGTLTASALGAAAERLGATVVFASPAALRNVLATADGASSSERAALGRVRLMMSAGAPVPAGLLRQLAELLPSAELHTPYGMTEALPVTDISLSEIEAAGTGNGVCVGLPLAGVQIALGPLDEFGDAGSDLGRPVGVPGEVWVKADHIKDGYDALWATEQLAAANPGWHRTGDIGQLDDLGRLWIQGRTVHVISTADGPVTPVGVEQRITAALSNLHGRPFNAAGVAVVGIGPRGTQVLAVVVQLPGGPLADQELTELVRAAAGVPIAPVLTKKQLPVDIRHNSKIDRTAVAAWATRVVAGG